MSYRINYSAKARQDLRDIGKQLCEAMNRQIPEESKKVNTKDKL